MNEAKLSIRIMHDSFRSPATHTATHTVTHVATRTATHTAT